MVKIEDGAIVTMSQLVTGETESDDGNPLKFERNDVAGELPTFTAEAKMNDDSNRTKLYTVNLSETKVRVSVTIQESSQEVEPPPTKPKPKDEDEGDKAKAKSPTTEARIVTTKVPTATESRSAIGKKNER